jgi:hypothetical protein
VLRLKRVFEMLDAYRSANRTGDRNHVEAARAILRGMLHEEVARRTFDLSLLEAPDDRWRWQLAFDVGPRFDLYENDGLSLRRD